LGREPNTFPNVYARSHKHALSNLAYKTKYSNLAYKAAV
jgi:hypothetical protein